LRRESLKLRLVGQVDEPAAARRATAVSFAASPDGRLKPMTLTIARVRPLLIRRATATGSPPHVSSPSDTT
jgi:hypothetical protein